MRPVLLALALCSLPVAVALGCSAEAPPGDGPAGTSTQPLLGICTPLTCCFPTGGGWGSNPFEDGLRSLGCTTPQAYTESYEASEWWLYSMCPTSLQLLDLVAEYALVSPYHSQVVVNECLELHAAGERKPLDVFVEWDPTCPPCAPRVEGY